MKTDCIYVCGHVLITKYRWKLSILSNDSNEYARKKGKRGKLKKLNELVLPFGDLSFSSIARQLI